MAMHKYPQLTNSQNILIEIFQSGAVTGETIMALLGLAESTASNHLRQLNGAGLLKRKNVHRHSKLGGPRYEYDLTSEGTRKVTWIKKNFDISA